MREESPEQIARNFFSAMEQMDFDRGLQFVADDVEYINSPDTRVTGHQGVRAVLEPFFEPIAENEFIIERVASAGEIVFVQRLDRHRIAQSWFELPVAAVLEIKSGRIVYLREYFDLGTVQSAMTALLEGAP
ncbi:MAG: limonene-1,2-epoxide hydrolase family protein [Pseudomonadota bacterium]